MLNVKKNLIKIAQNLVESGQIVKVYSHLAPNRRNSENTNEKRKMLQ